MSYGFREFVKEYKSVDPDDILEMLRDEDPKFNITDHSVECVDTGKSILDNEFDEPSRKLIIENALGFVAATLTMSGDIENIKVSHMILISPEFQNALKLMFYYTLGLSNKEGV